MLIFPSVFFTASLTLTINSFASSASTSFWKSKQEIAEEIVCQSKYFRARCSASDEVIVVRRARYGRMNLSRCVKENFGYIGCSNDVLDVLDGHCSGRHSCSLRVLDENFMNMKPCHEDLKSYLAVQYSCVKVVSPKKSVCLGDRPVIVSQPTAVLASLISAETGCGTGTTSWRLQVLAGQRINITLVDFSWATVPGGGVSGARQAPSAAAASATTSSISGTAAIGSPVDCRIYAIVRETPETVGVTVCGGETRVKTVFVSRSNSVDLQLITDADRTKPTPYKSNFAFVFVYEAVGCPDIEAPPGSWIQRTDRTILVGCSRTTDTWQLHCNKDLQWVGEMRNCSPAKLENVDGGNEEELIDSTLLFPSGLLVMIVLSMTLFVGLFILVIGVLCLTRLHSRRRMNRRNLGRNNSDESKQIVQQSPFHPSTVTVGHRPCRKPFNAVGGSTRTDDETICVGSYTLPPLTSDYGSMRVVRYGHLCGTAAKLPTPGALSNDDTSAAAATVIIGGSSPSCTVRTTLLVPPAMPSSVHRHPTRASFLMQDYGCTADESLSSTTTCSHHATSSGGGASDEGYASRPSSHSTGLCSTSMLSRKNTSTGLFDASDSGESGYGETTSELQMTSSSDNGCNVSVDGETLRMATANRCAGHRCHEHSTSSRLHQRKQQAIYFVLPSSTQSTAASTESSLISHAGRPQRRTSTTSPMTSSWTSGSTPFPVDERTAGEDDSECRRRKGDVAMCDLTSTVAGIVATPHQTTRELVDCGDGQIELDTCGGNGTLEQHTIGGRSELLIDAN